MFIHSFDFLTLILILNTSNLYQNVGVGNFTRSVIALMVFFKVLNMFTFSDYVSYEL